MQQTLPAGQRISIADVAGDLKIRGWDQQVISVTSDRNIDTLQSEGDVVMIRDCEDALELAVPYEQFIIAKNINGDVSAENVQQVELQEVSGNASLKAIAGEVRLGHIGGNVELKGIHGPLGVGSAGGNVFVEASFPPESVTRLRAGGNVHLVLPSKANLVIQATVGGIVHSPATVSAMGNHITLVYGDGAARLEISAGGNLELYGDQAPKSTSTYSGNCENFAHNWQNQWQGANAEFSAGFGASFTHVAEKQQRKAEKYRQKAEKQAKHANRMNIHINNREWCIEPQRIDKMVAEAYDAASRGTQGAVEAVEQALKNLHVTPPPSPPRHPKPPTPPSSGPSKPPTRPYGSPDVESVSHVSERPDEPPKQGESPVSATGPTGNSAINLEQERIAILRMVADGRITPEEGDMLLEAL